MDRFNEIFFSFLHFIVFLPTVSVSPYSFSYGAENSRDECKQDTKYA